MCQAGPSNASKAHFACQRQRFWNRSLFAVFFRAQVKGHAFFEVLPRLFDVRARNSWHARSIGRRRVRSIPAVQKLLAHICASPYRNDTFPEHYSNPKDVLGRLPLTCGQKWVVSEHQEVFQASENHPLLVRFWKTKHRSKAQAFSFAVD